MLEKISLFCDYFYIFRGMLHNNLGVIMLRIISILLFFLVSTIYPQWTEVKRIIDGDTFETTDGQIIRVKDIDTPETKHPLKGKEYLGEEATEFAKQTLNGKVIFLSGNKKDKYGRRVADVEFMDGTTYALRVRTAGYDKLTNYRGFFSTISKNKSLPSTSYFPHTQVNSQDNTIYNQNEEKEWVNGYFKSDGSYVEGYYRVKKNYTNSNGETYQGTTNSTERVNVKGYYRKNGTYVQPYTRSKGK
jgi:endonuclease YncB( thermonuclease family)